jgi:transposase-like protein
MAILQEGRSMASSKEVLDEILKDYHGPEGIMNELKNRGIQDILLTAVDGLTGFSDAIAAVFPKTEVQLCVLHMVRNPVRFVPYKDRKAVTAGLKKIYLSPSAGLAAEAPEEFAGAWDTKYPVIAKSWRNRWNEIVLFSSSLLKSGRRCIRPMCGKRSFP